jgi:hypothetical protein
MVFTGSPLPSSSALLPICSTYSQDAVSRLWPSDTPSVSRGTSMFTVECGFFLISAPLPFSAFLVTSSLGSRIKKSLLSRVHPYSPIFFTKYLVSAYIL